ncbi:hypothetical protein ACPZ19_51035 [Amycolatopsis lurida]
MRVQILAVPDCPNLTPLRRRLAEALADRDDLAITTEVVDTVEQAVRLGMNGSPTLLIDGIDPFAEPGQAPSLSCRLYRDESGNPTGVPSVPQLRAALDRPAGECRDTPTGAAGGLPVWRARTTPASPAGRAVHQAILRAFAATGRPPATAALQQLATAHGATAEQVLAQLHDTDTIRLDHTGEIGSPTRSPRSRPGTTYASPLVSGRTRCAPSTHSAYRRCSAPTRPSPPPNRSPAPS